MSHYIQSCDPIIARFTCPKNVFFEGRVFSDNQAFLRYLYSADLLKKAVIQKGYLILFSEMQTGYKGQIK